MKVTAVEELQGQSHHILLAQRQMRRRHHVPNTQPGQFAEQIGMLLCFDVFRHGSRDLRDTLRTKYLFM
jgi:hypothetical protein